ncbi:hypothetical protein CUV01_18160 [Paracoccus tegillarcae]|uniref:Uncharacterized protein n=1 Tax=Paracoccus tegillarcae TaxID=1529068 RepID=A0A2K9EUT9_9RHOB|nr:hypothetical protein CUV01_18160 [Paracoccus tegillarcae]
MGDHHHFGPCFGRHHRRAADRRRAGAGPGRAARRYQAQRFARDRGAAILPCARTARTIARNQPDRGLSRPAVADRPGN